MRAERHRPDEMVDDHRPLLTDGIVWGLAFGTLVLGVGTWFLVANAQQPGNSLRGRTQATSSQADSIKDVVSAILGDTEDVWREHFRMENQAYNAPRLVLFTGRVRSACGLAESALGPFYCPLDEKIYIDLSFFQELKDRYQAPGDFARAYVIAHEVGHHVQKLLGIPEKARARQQGLRRDQQDQMSVRLELQADFLAGVWAHHADRARHILEPGDIEAALRLLTAIGDDRLQLGAQGEVDPRAMTRCWDRRHGTAQQKVRWFSRGLKTGDLSQGDAIDATDL